MKVRFLRGTTEENNSLTLPAGEISINLDDMSLRLHDGVTQGGFECPSNMAFNLGPGPKTLVAGDYQLGYFGEISAAEFITGDQLTDEMGVSEGVGMNSTTAWLKFAYQGKILYVAKQPIRHSVSWETLYQSGLVYGVDDVGIHPAGANANQFSPTLIGTDGFKTRLLTGGNTDPATGAGGEWDQLMVAVTNGTFASLTTTELGVGSGNGATSWVQEAISGTLANRVGRGQTSIADYDSVAATTVTATMGWRPVLELTTVTKILFPPEDIYYETDYVKPSYVYDWSYSDAP